MSNNTTKPETPAEGKIKSQHTPGPWNEHPSCSSNELVITSSETGKKWISRQMYVAQGKKIICEVTLCRRIDNVDFGHPRVSDDAEFEANIKLIVAAPDLLASLKDCVIEVKRLALMLRDMDVSAKVQIDKVAEAEAAIAKAEGVK